MAKRLCEWHVLKLHLSYVCCAVHHPLVTYQGLNPMAGPGTHLAPSPPSLCINHTRLIRLCLRVYLNWIWLVALLHAHHQRCEYVCCAVACMMCFG